jgi:N-carbamoyl-L-amino-acid hydrolase
MNNTQPRINGERLWNRIMEMAKIGATAAGGSNRQALTDLDREGRDLFCTWAREAGCSIEIDQMGNIFARRPGTDQGASPVLAGSHLDTQPTGGKFDGVYGVLAALEVIETLNDSNTSTARPIEAVVWTNEEGARFSPAMIGSGVLAGEFTLEFGHAATDKSGKTIGDELHRIGYSGNKPCKAFPIHAAFEAHIEQGPILEANKKTIGVVTGVQGMRWYDVVLTGEPVHAGPTPMDMRRDPFRALHLIVADSYEMAKQYAPHARLTFGDIKAEPGARNTVPERLTLAADLRHPNEETLDEMEEEFRAIVERSAALAAVEGSVRVEWQSPAVEFNSVCVDAVRTAAQTLKYPFLEIVSGAGHDSVYLSRIAATAMIFVPCKGGISHNEAESAEPDDLAAGANVLFQAVMERANQ